MNSMRRMLKFAQILIACSLVGCVLAVSGCGSSRPEVVFIGASTMSRWPTYTNFPVRNWIARGVEGDTSSQVLARFQHDVFQPGISTVVIHCGINDMAAHYDENLLIANWTKMITMAKQRGLKVYIGTLQPYGSRTNQNSQRNSNVIAVDQKLLVLGPTLGAKVIDFHTALMGPDLLFVPEYTEDGVHPNQLGYDRMTKLTEAAFAAEKQ